ncbi:hypothetical protein HC891_01535 [Candidatus Gracilibacteria bacterium]|nr:hypothetical protein [Candidatus Gracilibacteria bacterium]
MGFDEYSRTTTEGSDVLAFSVTLSGPATEPVLVGLLFGGTAIMGEDYFVDNTALLFPVELPVIILDADARRVYVPLIGAS